MTITLVFLALLMAVLVGWLLSQSINTRPWATASSGAREASPWPEFLTAKRIGMIVLLAVITSLFALCISAYMMRMEMGDDWRALAEPALLWLNTLFLLLASVFFQWGWSAAKRDNPEGLKRGVTAGGAFTLAFIGGQYAVWQQLVAAGHYAGANPANAFFFLLTVLHALHLAGGLLAWGHTVQRVWRGVPAAELRPTVELCAVYWHYLFIVWAVLFGLVLST